MVNEQSWFFFLVHISLAVSLHRMLFPWILVGLKLPSLRSILREAPLTGLPKISRSTCHLPSLCFLFPALSPPTILSHVCLFVASLVSLEWKFLKAKVCDHFLHYLSSIPTATCLATVDVQEMLEGLSEWIHEQMKTSLYYWAQKAMEPLSSILAWKIPWMEEPGRLQSMGSLRVRHDWATSLSLFTFMRWRRKWQPTPVFLPGESQGWGSLVGCRLWGRIESDTTEAT